MKNKERLTVLAAIIFTATVFYTMHKNGKLKDQLYQKESVINEKNAVIQYRENQAGKLIAEKQATEISYKELQQSYPKLAEAIVKDFDIKIKNLRAYMSAEFQARGQGSSTINNHYYTDSTGVQIPFWKLKASDGYLNFLASVYDSTNAPYEYTYTDTIQYTFNVKKKWFLGNEKLYGSGLLGNPNAKITNSTSIHIKKYRDKRFYLGAGFSYGIDGKLLPSVHAGYSIIRF